MTSRMLLTLLAVLTGLAAQVSPAHARDLAARGAVVGSVSLTAETRTTNVPRGVSVAPVPVAAERADTRFAAEEIPAAGRFPAVLTRIDRAHE